VPQQEAPPLTPTAQVRLPAVDTDWVDGSASVAKLPIPSAVIAATRTKYVTPEVRELIVVDADVLMPSVKVVQSVPFTEY